MHAPSAVSDLEAAHGRCGSCLSPLVTGYQIRRQMGWDDGGAERTRHDLEMRGWIDVVGGAGMSTCQMSTTVCMWMRLWKRSQTVASIGWSVFL